MVGGPAMWRARGRVAGGGRRPRCPGRSSKGHGNESPLANLTKVLRDPDVAEMVSLELGLLSCR